MEKMEEKATNKKKKKKKNRFVKLLDTIFYSGRFSTCQAFQISNVVRNPHHSPTVRISDPYFNSKPRPFYFSDNRSNSHSYDWGTGGKLRHKRPRPEFRGEFGLNPITGRDEVHAIPLGEHSEMTS